MTPMASSDALRVIKSSEIRPSSRRKTTKVRTTAEIRNGGTTALRIRISILAIGSPEDYHSAPRGVKQGGQNRQRPTALGVSDGQIQLLIIYIM